MIESALPMMSDFWCDNVAKVPVYVSQPIQLTTRLARLVVMQKGQEISERRAWSNIEITVLTGRCIIEFEDHQVELGAHQRQFIPADVPHRLISLSDIRAVVSFDADGVEFEASHNLPRG